MYWMRIGVLLLLADILALQGCYEITYDREVTIRPANKFVYEIQMHGRGEGRGNPHDLLDFKALKLQKWDNYTWIYLNRLEGEINARDIVLTPHWRCTDKPYAQSELIGSIKFENGNMIVSLEGPIYDKDGIHVSKHAPMNINGTYRIAQILTVPLESTAKEVRNDFEASYCNRTSERP